MIVTLDGHLRDEAIALGIARHEHCVEHSLRRGLGVIDSRRAHIMGAVGEYVFWLAYGCDKPEHNPFGDGGHGDAVFPNGKTASVKATLHADPHFVPNPQRPFIDDYGALIRLNQSRDHQILGVVNQSYWQEHHFLRDFGRGFGPQPVIHWRDMQDPDEFRNIIWRQT